MNSQEVECGKVEFGRYPGNGPGDAHAGHCGAGDWVRPLFYQRTGPHRCGGAGLPGVPDGHPDAHPAPGVYTLDGGRGT